MTSTSKLSVLNLRQQPFFVCFPLRIDGNDIERLTLVYVCSFF